MVRGRRDATARWSYHALWRLRAYRGVSLVKHRAENWQEEMHTRSSTWVSCSPVVYHASRVLIVSAVVFYPFALSTLTWCENRSCLAGRLDRVCQHAKTSYTILRPLLKRFLPVHWSRRVIREKSSLRYFNRKRSAFDGHDKYPGVLFSTVEKIPLTSVLDNRNTCYANVYLSNTRDGSF